MKKQVTDPNRFPNNPSAIAKRGWATRRRRRGKQKAPTKVPLYIRVDPAALDAWRATGKGWQTRLAESIASTAPQGAGRN